MQDTLEIVPVGAADPLRDASLAREIAERFFVWDAFVGGHRRVDVHPLLLPLPMHEAAVRAAEGVVRVVGAVASRAHVDAAERARYGFHEDYIRAHGGFGGFHARPSPSFGGGWRGGGG